MDYNTLEKLGKAVLYGNILASIHTPAQTKVQFDTALEMYKKYVGNVYDNTLPAPADVGAVEGDRCLLNVDNDYEAYEVVDGVWKKYTKPEVREYVDNLIKDFISKNGDNTFSGSNTFTKPIVGDLSGNADTATKATQDSEGNVIKDTYATKTECESKATLDATQMLAVNSGITASKVAEYEAMKTSKVNEADIKTVAKTGSYSDLLNKPTINNSTINIKVNGVSIGTFTTNSANAKDIAITVPTKMSDLDNDSDYVASTTLHDYVKNTDLTAHTSDTNIHTTTADKAKWNGKQDALSSQQIANINDVTNKANDSNVVHKSGDETISDSKTFSKIVLKSSRIERGALPSSNINEDNEIEIVDKNNRRILGIFNYYYTTGSGRTSFYAYNPNTIDYDNLAIAFDFDNTNNQKSLIPISNNTVNLGTSTNKWKTINGVNPGALSLPNFNALDYKTVDTTNWVTTKGNDFYPEINGWYMIRTVTGSVSIVVNNTQIGQNSTNYGVVLVPVIKNVRVTVYIHNVSSGNVMVSTIYPCQGNV